MSQSIQVKNTDITFTNASSTSKKLEITSGGALSTNAVFQAANGIQATNVTVTDGTLEVQDPTFEGVTITNGSGSTSLASHASASSLSLTLPSADGTSGQALVTDGSGQLSFAAASGGGITSDMIAYNNASGYDKSVTTNASWNSTNSYTLSESDAFPSTGLYYVYVQAQSGSSTSANLNANFGFLMVASDTTSSYMKYNSSYHNDNGHGLTLEVTIGASMRPTFFTYPNGSSNYSRTTQITYKKVL